MCNATEISLIDLNSSIREGCTSMPLLLLPRINSPYEGDISSDFNNPFDSADQDASNPGDPFEFVSKKVQEFTESGKSDQPDSTMTSDINVLQGGLIEVENGNESADKNYSSVNENELAGFNKPTENVTTNIKSETAVESKSDSEKCEVISIKKLVEWVDIPSHVNSECNHEFMPEIVCDKDSQESELKTQDMCTEDGMNIEINTSSGLAVSNYTIVSPEAKGPKYCSTPIHSLGNSKRQHEVEHSPVSRRTESNMTNLSPVSMVKARIEKCIEKAEERFKRNDKLVLNMLERKLNCRKSLDSQLSPLSSSPYYQRDISFRCDQSLSGKYTLKYTDPLIPIDEIRNSFKSLQKQSPLESMVSPEGSFSTPRKVQDPESLKIKMFEEEIMPQQEARYLSKLLEKTNYNDQKLEDESIISFIETDEEDSNYEEREEFQVAKRKKIAESRKVNSNRLKIEMNFVEDDNLCGLDRFSKLITPLNQQESKTENRSKSIVSKLLGNVQQFAPKIPRTINKPRNSTDFAGASKSNFQVQKCQVNRSRSDSTLAALKKKENRLQSPKYALKESSTFSNLSTSSGAKLMQSKQPQAKHLGKVSKPPKPLSQMFRNKKYLFTGKDKIQ